MTSPFCTIDPSRVFLRLTHVFAMWDGFPVTPGHALIVPYRHVATWFGASDEERAERTGGMVDPRGGVRHVIGRADFHNDRSYSSSEEAHEIARLLTQRCRNEHCAVSKPTLDDIPHRREVQPAGRAAEAAPAAWWARRPRRPVPGSGGRGHARVHDHLREAYLPRSKAFLFSRDRINVAVSRAPCLAVIVASPALLEDRCNSVEDFALLNLRWRTADVLRPIENGIERERAK
jgi:hypothetical protein